MVTEIQKRLVTAIGAGAKFERALGLALYNGARLCDVNDAYHLALWFEGAPWHVKREFIAEFDVDDLRVCSCCGRFMTEGYLLEMEYACSDACAIAWYGGDEEMFREDLDSDGDFFWTEW